MPVDLATTVLQAWEMVLHHVRLAIRVQATTRSPYLAVPDTIKMKKAVLCASLVLLSIIVLSISLKQYLRAWRFRVRKVTLASLVYPVRYRVLRGLMPQWKA